MAELGKELVNKLAEEHEVFTVSRKAGFWLRERLHREVEDYTEDLLTCSLHCRQRKSLKFYF